MGYDGQSVKEKIFRYFFTTVFWGEKIYLNIFSPPYFGGENIFKNISTTIFLGEKIYLNIFSPPYFVGRKYILIYFLSPKYVGEINI